MSIRQYDGLNLSDNATGNYKIIIAGLGDRPVTGAIEEDLGLASGNDFNTAGEALQDLPIVGNAIAFKNKLRSIVDLSGSSATTELETRKVWNNSKVPGIPLSFTMYQSSSNNESIIQRALRLQRGTLPTRSGEVFRAPLNYRFLGDNSREAQGTVVVQIGTWFRATSLVITDVNVTYSKEVNNTGNPISAKVTVTFEPFRSITYQEFENWFIGI